MRTHPKVLWVILACSLALFAAGCGSSGSTTHAPWFDGGGLQPPPALQVTGVDPTELAPGDQCTIRGTGFGAERSRDNGQSYVSFDPAAGGEGVNATEYTAWSDSEIICTIPEVALSRQGAGYVVVVHRVTASGESSSSTTSTAANTVTIETGTTGTVKGRVTDAATGTGIDGATVMAGGQTATTAGGGYYTLNSVPEGVQTVNASAPSYIPESAAVTVTSDTPATADIALYFGVTITDGGYAPQVVPIGPGATIYWKNTGTAVHSVISDGGPAFAPTGLNGADPANLQPGQYCFCLFGVVGIYNYHDAHNAALTGTVEVTTDPVITGVNPATGNSLSTVTLTGMNFGDTIGANTVTIGGTDAAIGTWTDTEVEVTPPAGLVYGTAYPVHITVNGITDAQSFTFGLAGYTAGDDTQADWLGGSSTLCDRYETAGSVTLLPLSDTFNTNFTTFPNPDRWVTYYDPSAAPVPYTFEQPSGPGSGRLRADVPSGPPSHSVAFYPKYRTKGDFEAYADFSNLAFTNNDGWNFVLGFRLPDFISFTSNDYMEYVHWTPGVLQYNFVTTVFSIIPTGDMSGRLQLTRTGSTIYGYHWSAGAPVLHNSINRSTADGDLYISFSSWLTCPSCTLTTDNFTITRYNGIANPVYIDQGTFTSRVHDTGQATARFEQLDWAATVPAGTTLQLQVATSGNAAGPWNYAGPDGTAGTYYTTSGQSPASPPTGRYMRYMVYCTSNAGVLNQTPSLDSTTITYTY